MAVENRAAGRLPAYLLGRSAAARSSRSAPSSKGKLGQAIASPALTLVDDPLVPKGFGSRLFDGEGIAARRMPIVEAGVLKSYFIDTYYGKKLQMAPTTAARRTSSGRSATRTRPPSSPG
jgi:Predicted Zn-dependent proteases and their inactivated homologs